MEKLIFEILNYFQNNYLNWIIFPVVILIGGFFVKMASKFIVKFFDSVDYDRTLELVIIKTSKYFLWAIVFVIALANIGFDVSGFIAGLGIMGFIVGFAVKDVLSNLAAGIFIIVKRPFKVGESVDVAGVKGTVEEVTLSSCVIITDDKQYVTVPNIKIWGNPIRNLSRLN